MNKNWKNHINKELQRFTDILIKYVKDLTMTGTLTYVHYEFKDFENEEVE